MIAMVESELEILCLIQLELAYKQNTTAYDVNGLLTFGGTTIW